MIWNCQTEQVFIEGESGRQEYKEGGQGNARQIQIVE